MTSPSQPPSQLPPPGWYPDPEHHGFERYWTGTAWGDRHPAGRRGDAPPPAGPGKRRRRFSLFRLIVGLAALVFILIIVIVIAAIASSNKPGVGSSSHPAAADVTITGCSIDSIGFPQATGVIVNHSSGMSDYTFTVSFRKGGVQVAEGTGIENNIAAHQTADWTATTDAQATGPVTCVVSDVNRFASS